MTDTPKRRSALARPSQHGLGARSIEAFVARANEELSAVATAKALETREAREDELRREVERLQAGHATEVARLHAQLASRRRRARVMVVSAFLLGGGATFAIDLVRAPSRDGAGPPPQAAIENSPGAITPPPTAVVTPLPEPSPGAVTPPPTAVVTPLPEPSPGAVTPPPTGVVTPPPAAVVTPLPESPPVATPPAQGASASTPVVASPPPVAARPAKKKPIVTPILEDQPEPSEPAAPAAPKPPPPPPEDLVNPF
ncbi:MAG: hypothetical protein JNL83_36200 [Myxococcales bacterium]|nr:hypothetical protein [Myxococcales bacterium]